MIISLIMAGLVLVLTWRRPALGLAALSFLLPGYLVRFTVGGIPTTLLEISLYACLLGTALTIIQKRSPRPRARLNRRFLLLVILWAAAWIFSTIFSQEVQASLGALKAWWFDPLLYTALVWTIARGPAERKIYVQSLVLSATLVALAGLFQILFVRESLQEGRLSSFFAPVANYAAMYLVPLTILAAALIVFRHLSRAWWFYVGLLVLAIGLTLSYGGYIATAAGAIVIWKFLPHSPIKARTALAGGILAVVILGLLSTTNNFQQHFDLGRSSGSVRKQIWVTSWALIQEDPIFGVGPNAFEPAYRAEIPKHYYPPLEWDVAKPHNLFLALWLETGLLGLITFLIGMVLIIRALIRKTRDDTSRPWAIASLAALTTILVHGFVDTTYFKNDLALIFMAILLLPWLAETQPGQAARR